MIQIQDCVRTKYKYRKILYKMVIMAVTDYKTNTKNKNKIEDIKSLDIRSLVKIKIKFLQFLFFFNFFRFEASRL